MSEGSNSLQPESTIDDAAQAAGAILVSRVKTARDTATTYCEATEIIEQIRSGDRLRETVTRIREKFWSVMTSTGNDRKAAKQAIDSDKKRLPAITWSGKFSRRKQDALLQHSGLLCADLDGLGPDKIPEVRAKLVNSLYVWALFLSPTGDGIKCVFRVPADAEKHKASFRAIEKHVHDLTGAQIDESCSDVSRLCFLSHDPDAYLNENAVELPPLIEVAAPAVPVPSASSETEIEVRRRVAVELLGEIKWSTETRGHCTCPGQNLHTTGNGERDCEVYLDGAPTLSCFHNHCRDILKEKNHELRSRIGKVERDSDEATLARLAALPLLEYERCRKAESDRLGCRESVLNTLVSAKRRKKADSALQGSAVIFPEVELWPEAVCGPDVLNEVAETFGRYIALPDGAADALALWCAHAHGFKAFICSPRLNISSPEKCCGKTTLRDVIGVFVPRPVLTENLSVAVLFRLVEAHAPTILADEYDSWIKDNEELRGLLNAGHRRGAAVFRCEGDGNEVRAFAAYSPAVLCGIGALPATLHDRSIVVRLERAKPAELHNRFDPRHTECEQEVYRQLARWVADNVAQLESADPLLPDGVFNRLADNWRPLFAIAEIAGSDWPQRCATAFAKLTSRDDAEAQGLGVTLLIDIRQVFRENGADRMFSRNLVESLSKMTERPWPEIQRGKPITERWLARKLAHFGIHSKTLRIGEERAKGYETAHFTEAFERYIPAEEQTIRDTVTSSDNGAFPSVTSTTQCHGC
jgi:hypothetical protein